MTGYQHRRRFVRQQFIIAGAVSLCEQVEEVARLVLISRLAAHGDDGLDQLPPAPFEQGTLDAYRCGKDVGEEYVCRIQAPDRAHVLRYHVTQFRAESCGFEGE